MIKNRLDIIVSQLKETPEKQPQVAKCVDYHGHLLGYFISTTPENMTVIESDYARYLELVEKDGECASYEIRKVGDLF